MLDRKLRRESGGKVKNNPDYYQINGKDTMETIISIVKNNYLSVEESILLFNILKYLVRFGNKNGESDLMKVKDYLERLMEVYGKDGKKNV